MLNVFTDALTQMVVALVPCLVAVAVVYVRKWTNVQVSAQQQAQLAHFARSGVLLASQELRKRTGGQVNQEKLEMARQHLIEEATAAGVKIATDKATRLVEGMVNQLKRERGALD